MSGRSNALPLGMKGTCCELNEETKTRFFEIHWIEYSPDDVERLKQIDCFEESILGEYLRHINPQAIDESTFFLYKLETYYADPLIADSWEFNATITEYERHYFALFDTMVQFCTSKWSISPVNFVSRQDTRIPR